MAVATTYLGWKTSSSDTIAVPAGTNRIVTIGYVDNTGVTAITGINLIGVRGGDAANIECTKVRATNYGSTMRSELWYGIVPDEFSGNLAVLITGGSSNCFNAWCSSGVDTSDPVYSSFSTTDTTSSQNQTPNVTTIANGSCIALLGLNINTTTGTTIDLPAGFTYDRYDKYNNGAHKNTTTTETLSYLWWDWDDSTTSIALTVNYNPSGGGSTPTYGFSKVAGVAAASISKVAGVAIASIDKVIGVS